MVVIQWYRQILTACCTLHAVILLEFAVIHMLKPLSKHFKTVQHFTVCGTQSFLTSSVEFWRNAKAKTKGVKNSPGKTCPGRGLRSSRLYGFQGFQPSALGSPAMPRISFASDETARCFDTKYNDWNSFIDGSNSLKMEYTPKIVTLIKK